MSLLASSEQTKATRRKGPAIATTEATVASYAGERSLIVSSYFAADREAEYCNERVCVSVCLSVRDHIFGTARPIFTNFLCMLPMAVARFCSGGVVIGPTLCISGFMDAVIFAQKLRLLDVSARLRQRGSHAALDLARRNTRCRQRTH